VTIKRIGYAVGGRRGQLTAMFRSLVLAVEDLPLYSRVTVRDRLEGVGIRTNGSQGDP